MHAQKIRGTRGPLLAAACVAPLLFVGGSPAQADAEVATAPAAMARPCGATIRLAADRRTQAIWYRHCTTGSDSVRVKAIIRFCTDGGCRTVRAGATLAIWTFITPPGYYDRIDRC